MVERPILEVNSFFAQAQTKLGQWSRDASEVLSGTATLFPADTIVDDIFTILLAPRNDVDDGKVKEVVQLFCKCILEVAERQVGDQLPGGKYDQPSATLQEEAASCTANNISGERIFAKLDASIKRAPNASHDYHKSKIYAIKQIERKSGLRRKMRQNKQCRI